LVNPFRPARLIRKPPKRSRTPAFIPAIQSEWRSTSERQFVLAVPSATTETCGVITYSTPTPETNWSSTCAPPRPLYW
jgi:hypothetical protein